MFKLRRDGHIGKVQNRYCGTHCQWVHDVSLFVTVQLFEETPSVLSLGKLCEDHGYSCEWVSGQKPRLTKDGKSIICKTDNCVPLVVPGLSANFGSVSCSTSVPQESLRTEADQASGNSKRSAASSSSGSVLQQSDEMAYPKTKIIRGMPGTIRTKRWQTFLRGWRSSKKIW